MLAQGTFEALVQIHQGAGYAMLDSASLASHAAANHFYLDAVFALGIGDDEWLLDHAPVVNKCEKLLVGFAVDDNAA
jgi:hypothetical protein